MNKTTTKTFMPFLLSIAIFIQMLDSTILNTALPAIGRDLNESAINMQSTIISYVLTLAVFIPISGYAADRYGTKRVFIFSLFLFSLGSLGSALSTTLVQLDLSRVVQGLGGALMTPVARLALIKTFSKNEILRAINYAVIPALLGPILGPLVGGYLVDYVSWHWIFLINIPISFVAILFSFFYMPDYKEENPILDLKGFFIFAIASIVLSIGLEWLGHPPFNSIVFILIFAGFLFFYLYYRHALKKEQPLFSLELFKIRTFSIGIFGGLVTRLGISAIPLLIPIMLQVAYKQSAFTAGVLMAPVALAAMLTRPFVIRLFDYFGFRKILIGNTIIVGIVIMTLAIPSSDTNIYWYLPVLFFMGILNSIQFTALNTIALADLKEEQNSSGNSLLTVNQQLSIGFGVAVGISILQLVEQVLSNENPLQSFRYTFVIVGVITILSSFIFRRLEKTDGDSLKSTGE